MSLMFCRLLDRAILGLALTALALPAAACAEPPRHFGPVATASAGAALYHPYAARPWYLTPYRLYSYYRPWYSLPSRYYNYHRPWYTFSPAYDLYANPQLYADPHLQPCEVLPPRFFVDEEHYYW
jgi:hypothetical protein